MSPEMLMKIALEARKKAYAPYSHFFVGAALLCSDGSVYQGCNIENASYTPTCCAERVALFKAVSEGKRDFCAIAVAGGADEEADELCYPCGVCRQALSEFCAPDTEVLLGNGKVLTRTTLGQLLPYAFKIKDQDN